ncbi:hypothetical protein C8R46DRAFT_1205375 [Mycena filopes]|nr:hypothetical protein C8R46DRAFT_1205375 [Mycena filopes]
MSSTTSVDSSSSAAVPAQPTATLSSSSYFFGFLVAFIAFLMVFLSLGVIARRRRMRLMRDLLMYGDDAPEIPNTAPLMWEPSFVEARSELCNWRDVMPLSTVVVQREVVDDKALVDEEPATPTGPRNLLVKFFGFPPKPRRKPTPKKIRITEAMNIAVMIEMPQEPATLKAEEEGHEYHIGTLRVPWTAGDLRRTER